MAGKGNRLIPSFGRASAGERMTRSSKGQSFSPPGKVSVILPVYRGGPFIRRTLEDLLAWLNRMGRPFEVLVVDDGSDDNTAQQVEQGRAANLSSQIQLLRNPRNQGKGACVRRGMLEADGQFRVFVDSDMPYGLDSLGQALRMLEAGADVAIASRVHPESRYVISPRMLPIFTVRHWMSRIGNRVIRLCVPGLYDTQAGLKGFRKEAALHIFSQQRLNRFSFDVEVLRIAQVANFRIVEFPVMYHYNWEPTTVEFIRDSLRTIRDLVRIKIWEKQERWRPS